MIRPDQVDRDPAQEQVKGQVTPRPAPAQVQAAARVPVAVAAQEEVKEPGPAQVPEMVSESTLTRSASSGDEESPVALMLAHWPVRYCRVLFSTSVSTDPVT